MFSASGNKKRHLLKKNHHTPFIQNRACRLLRHQPLRCRECRSNTADHQCRFFSFRRYILA